MKKSIRELLKDFLTWIYVCKYNQTSRPNHDVLVIPRFVHSGRFAPCIINDAARDDAYVIVKSLTHKNVITYLYNSKRVYRRQEPNYVVTIDEFLADPCVEYQKFYIDSSCSTIELEKIKHYLDDVATFKRCILGGAVWNQKERNRVEKTWRKLYVKLMKLIHYPERKMH